MVVQLTSTAFRVWATRVCISVVDQRLYDWAAFVSFFVVAPRNHACESDFHRLQIGQFGLHHGKLPGSQIARADAGLRTFQFEQARNFIEREAASCARLMNRIRRMSSSP